MRQIRTDAAGAGRLIALLRKAYGLPIAGRNIGAGPHVDPPPSTTDWALVSVDSGTGERVVLIDATVEAVDDDNASGNLGSLRDRVRARLTIAERIELRTAIRNAISLNGG